MLHSAQFFLTNPAALHAGIFRSRLPQYSHHLTMSSQSMAPCPFKHFPSFPLVQDICLKKSTFLPSVSFLSATLPADRFDHRYLSHPLGCAD